MRWVTIQTERGPRACGVWQGQYVDVNSADPEAPSTVRELLSLGLDWQRRAWWALPQAIERHDPAGATLLAPVPDPRKIVCLGLNYRDHAVESGMEIPPEPVLFSKYPTTLIGHRAEIVLPEVSSEVDYEAELVVVIGQKARNVTAARALDIAAGYAAGQDISDRKLQFSDKPPQFSLGKSIDSFGPLGPEVVSLDGIPDPNDLEIVCTVNDERLQYARTTDMVFSAPELVAYLSRFCTLEPGDLIFTGTPAGVGSVRNPRRYLKPGDVIGTNIEHVGALVNVCVAS